LFTTTTITNNNNNSNNEINKTMMILNENKSTSYSPFCNKRSENPNQFNNLNTNKNPDVKILIRNDYPK
jgi:hypothetical protein